MDFSLSRTVRSTIIFILLCAAVFTIGLRFNSGLDEQFTRKISALLFEWSKPAAKIEQPCGSWSVSDVAQPDAPGKTPAEDVRCAFETFVKTALEAESKLPPTRGGLAVTPAPVKKLGANPYEKKIEDTIRKSLRPAVLALNIPDRIEIGKTTALIAVIQTSDDQDISKLVASGQGEVSRSEMKITPEVQIVVHGGDLEITPEEGAWRTLTRIAPALWSWKLTSATEGEKLLTIVVRGKVRLGDDERAFDAFVTTKKITFFQPAIQRLAAAAESAQKFTDVLKSLWLVLSGVVAGVGAFAMRRVKRDKPSEATAGGLK